MATTNVVNSTLMGVFILDSTYKRINHATDGSMSFSHEPRDITSKDSSGHRALLEGLRSWTMSMSGNFAYDATYGPESLRATWLARTPLTARWGTGVSADQYVSGTVYISSYEESSPDKENNVTFSVTFEGSGAPTFADLT